MVILLCVRGTYTVIALDAWFWYEGKSGMRPGENWWWNSQVRSYTIEDLKKAAEQHRITHLVLEGSLPEDLDQLVPSLTHLSISKLTEEDHPKLGR